MQRRWRRTLHRTGLPLAAVTARAKKTKDPALRVSSEVCSDTRLFPQLLRFSVCVLAGCSFTKYEQNWKTLSQFFGASVRIKAAPPC